MFLLLNFSDGIILVDTSEISRLESLGVGIYTVAPLARLSSSEPKILLINLPYFVSIILGNTLLPTVMLGSE